MGSKKTQVARDMSMHGAYASTLNRVEKQREAERAGHAPTLNRKCACQRPIDEEFLSKSPDGFSFCKFCGTKQFSKEKVAELSGQRPKQQPRERVEQANLHAEKLHRDAEMKMARMVKRIQKVQADAEEKDETVRNVK